MPVLKIFYIGLVIMMILSLIIFYIIPLFFKPVYYRVFDEQTGSYFATGYNAESMEELIEDFQSYILGANEIDFEHEEGTLEYEEELFEYLGTWEKIEEYLQGVCLEISDVPFEELDW